VKTLAWRNTWEAPELDKEAKAALLERDAAKRAAMYQDIQKKVLANSPFVFIFQQTEVAGYRKGVNQLQARSELRYQLRRHDRQGMIRQDW
jgi:peptide/nickel transport system substrate-binding protein